MKARPSKPSWSFWQTTVATLAASSLSQHGAGATALNLGSNGLMGSDSAVGPQAGLPGGRRLLDAGAALTPP